ncbi:MAG: hypothetical protein U0625_01755 [Phycisphaerales bacterium]
MERFVLRAGFLSACVACAAGLAPASPACAQDALGSGNALGRDTRHQGRGRGVQSGVLDANSRVGANGENAAAAKVDYFSRNLIVTGDVGGGREFRGSVGYKEQSEFAGRTGADDNRNWRAYSVYSSPYLLNAGYNPLQASQEFGAIMYSRTYSNASARDILTNQQPLDARIAFDRFTAAGTKMKRQADIIAPANVNSVGNQRDWRKSQKAKGGDDSARGIPVDDLLGGLGLSSFDRQRLKQDILEGRTKKEWVGDPVSAELEVAPVSIADAAQVRALVPPEYGTIVDSLRQRAGDRIKPPASATGLEGAAREKEMTKELDSELDWLRGELMQSGIEGRGRSKKPGKQDLGAPGPEGGTGPRALPGTEMNPPAGGKTPAKDGTEVTGVAGVAGATGAAGTMADGKMQPPSIDDLAYVLRHGKSMQSLVPEDSSAIKDMMELGAVSMREGAFFRAEERFASVLQVVPSSPLALAGVANAQLGAGLYVSSALSLRKLFAMHPEMIGTRFGTEVIPSVPRLDAALAAARSRLASANLPNASEELRSDRFDFGLLIAYIGFQTGRPEVVNEGLDGMRQTLSNDTLVKLLQKVWSPESAPAAPAPAAAPESPSK